MANSIVEQAKVAVALDGRDAETVLSELTAKTEQYTDALTKAFQAGDKLGMKKALKDLKDTEKQLEQVKKQTFDVTKVLNNLNGASLKDLRKAEQEITDELKKMTRGTQEYVDKSKQLQSVSSEINKVRTEMKGTTESTSMWGKAMGGLKGLLPIASIGAFVGGVIAAGKELFTLSKTMEADSRKSSIVLGESLGYVQGEAEKLSAKMGVTNREFVAMVANSADLLVPLGFARQQASEMSVQLQGLSGALNEWSQGQYGAEEISKRLSKAILGETESLKELGIGISLESNEYKELYKQKMAIAGTTQEQAKAMTVLELIQRKTTDAQSAYAASGNELLRSGNKLSAWWKTMKENVVEYFQTPTVSKLEKERLSVNALALQLFDSNLKYEDRKRILGELNAIAPQVAANLNAENLNYEQLRKNLEEFNNQMINKIVLQTKDEQIEKQNAEVAKVRMDRLDAENKIRENLIKVNEIIQKQAGMYNGITIENAAKAKAALFDANKPLEERIAIIDKISKTSGLGINGALFADISNEQRKLNALKIEENELTGESNKMAIARQALAEQLGLNSKKQAEEQVAAVKVETEASKQAADEKAKQLQKQIEDQQKYLQDVLLMGKTATEKEKLEYDERLKKAGLFGLDRKKMSADQLKALEILEQQHGENLQKIADDAANKKKADQDKWNKEILQINDESNKAVLAILQERYIKELEAAGTNIEAKEAAEEKYRLDYITAEIAHMEEVKALMLQLGIDTLDIDEQIRNKRKEKADAETEKLTQAEDAIKQKANERKTALDEYELISEEEKYEEKKKILEERYEEGILSEEEYEKAKFNMHSQHVEKTLQKDIEYINRYQTLLSGLSSMVSGFQQAELTESDTRKEAELKAAGDNAEKRKAIEDKYQKEQAAIKKKYAKQEFMLKVSQIVASTAVAAMEAYKSMVGIPLVGPVLAAVAAGAAIAAGAAQIAVARAELNKVTQAAKGKYNVTGKDDGLTYNNVPFAGEAQTGIYTSPTLIAERGPELVLSAPHTRNLQMNYPAILNAIMATRVPQRADGNYQAAATAPAPAANSNDQLVMILAAVATSVNTLNSKLDNLYAKVVMDEFKQEESRYNAMMNDVTKS